MSSTGWICRSHVADRGDSPLVPIAPHGQTARPYPARRRGLSVGDLVAPVHDPDLGPHEAHGSIAVWRESSHFHPRCRPEPSLRDLRRSRQRDANRGFGRKSLPRPAAPAHADRRSRRRPPDRGGIDTGHQPVARGHEYSLEPRLPPKEWLRRARPWRIAVFRAPAGDSAKPSTLAGSLLRASRDSDRQPASLWTRCREGNDRPVHILALGRVRQQALLIARVPDALDGCRIHALAH